MTYEIKLEGLQFQAHHGVYDYEKKTGNTFVLDLCVRFPLSRIPLHDNIQEAPDYQLLHRVASEEMKVPKQLLETVAASISKKLWSTFSDASHIRVCIKKMNPPIGAICEASVVVLESESPF
ncbi:MAG: folB [Chitinophagaceae bacterium]|nr:folB [Chitinophagaceae bacterium]